jgi:precorrin-6A/cobalt-precorrin-6A reductase
MIAIFAGTGDGREIIEKLLDKNISIVVFTATDYGKSLIRKDKNIKIYAKPMEIKEMAEIFVMERIKTIIDATHPYAVTISENLIRISQLMKIRYMRYERARLVKRGQEECMFFKKYEEMVGYLMTKVGHILLTTGSNHLSIFTENLERERLYARILPLPSVIQKSIDLGLKPKNIIAMEGPFSTELNKALINDYNIAYLVTKDSGEIGGVQEKMDAAKETGCELLVLERPFLNYGEVYNHIEDIVNRSLY